MHYLRLILFNFNNTEYSSADDNSRSKGNNSNKDKSAVSLTLLARTIHIVLLEKPLIENSMGSFFYLVGSLFCKRHIVCRRIPMSKPNGHRIAIGILNARSQGVDLHAGISYLCQMNEFAGVSSDNKLFCPPGQTPKVMWEQTISVGNSWSRCVECADLSCRFGTEDNRATDVIVVHSE